MYKRREITSLFVVVEFWHVLGDLTCEAGVYISLFTRNHVGVKEEEREDWWLLLHRALAVFPPYGMSTTGCREMILGDLQMSLEGLLLVTAWCCPADILFCLVSVSVVLSLSPPPLHPTQALFSPTHLSDRPSLPAAPLGSHTLPCLHL